MCGSWAARRSSADRARSVGGIDLLVIGSPDHDALYAAAATAEQRLGRPAKATIQADDWLKTGTGDLHATVTARPLVDEAEDSVGAGGGALIVHGVVDRPTRHLDYFPTEPAKVD